MKRNTIRLLALMISSFSLSQDLSIKNNLRVDDDFNSEGILHFKPANTNSQLDSLQLKYNHYTLQNGLEVILQPDKNVNEVSVEFWIRDGTAIDNPNEYGLQHFFEHVMPYNKMDSVSKKVFFDSYLKGSNAQVKKDFSRFYLKVIPEGINLALERASGRLIAGANAITENRIEYERKKVLLEIKRNAKNPHWSAEGSLAISEGTFGKGHPYAANGYGKLENNRAFSVNDFKRRYEEIIFSENIILFVVGNFDMSRVKKLVHQYFSKVESKKRLVNEVSKHIVPSNDGISMKTSHQNDSLNTMVFSWAIPNYQLKDDAVLRLISAHLNNSFKAKNYFPFTVIKSGAYADMYKTAGQFHLRIQFPNANDSIQIEKFILGRIKRLVKKNLTVRDLGLAKESEIMDIKEMRENLGFQWSRTALLGESLLYYDNPNAYFERLQIQQGLTAKQVRKVFKKWMVPKPFRILFSPNIE
ncbi:M16 family metallopeptidase [Croceitalea marina]|uniref:M16 family metallopeptidase n=1 Tax=Croceitalea marina TaxID=1775166 RepID=A0ABW5N3I2_9FLAO